MRILPRTSPSPHQKKKRKEKKRKGKEKLACSFVHLVGFDF
jgi:hypothetical protein